MNMLDPIQKKPKLPTGRLTFLFTDIVCSSKMWEQFGDGFIPVWQAHDAILRDAIGRYQGYEVKSEGDAFMVAFQDPCNAMNCALYAQKSLARYPWPADVGPVRVRMAMHTGEPFVFHNDYFGPVVNRAAHLCKAAHGGQVLLSDETWREVEGRSGPDVMLRDGGEARLKDMGEPMHVYEAVLAENDAAIPSVLRTLDAQPNNLPMQRTSFLGRAREIEAIASFLAQGEKPLLTVIGPGGIGKTRLSLQAAAATSEWFPDGVWFIRLVAARDLVGAAVEIAATIGVPIDPNRSALEQVRVWLADRRCLLILDDAGEVPHADRLIRELLSGTTGLRCLATARESLQIKDSHELPLSGLSLIPLDHAVVSRKQDKNLLKSESPKDQTSEPIESTEPDLHDALETLTQSEAGRLFLERAVAVNPKLKLNAAEMTAAVQLLKQLEGTPVSIERAAQLMDRVSPSMVLEWLNRRLEPDRVPAKSPGVQKFRELVRGTAQKVSDRVETWPRTLEVNLGRLLQGVADFATDRLDVKHAAELGQQTLRLSCDTGDTLGMAAALRQLAQVKWKQGDRQSATALLTTAAQLYRESDPEHYPEVQRELEKAREQVGLDEGLLPAPPTLDRAVALALEEKS